MKAQLQNGEIIKLEKDCDCRTHEGPHWLHMDAFDKEQNRKLREDADKHSTQSTFANYAQAVALYHRFAELEQVRYSEQLRQMEAQRIVRLIAED